MRLFIAEKPSLARAIAAALPLPQRRYREHIQCGGGNVVAWCAGHILEPVMPEHYDRRYARWSVDDLPIVPTDWRLRASVPGLLSSLKMLLRSAERVVHAGDPDREGQLLVDEVLDFLGYKGSVDRLLLRDLSPEAVGRALDRLEPNTRYRPLGTAALARQRADWLYGINMTRLYSLLGQTLGSRRVLSVGRVQTPVLGMIVERDEAIEAFKPWPYFAVKADVIAPTGEAFAVSWAPRSGSRLITERNLESGMPLSEADCEGRVVSEPLASEAADRVRMGPGRVETVDREEKSDPPPLPYSLADLQIDAGRRLGLSAQDVSNACQSLYELHRLTTYPRSDCAYLPEGQLGGAKAVLAGIAVQVPELAGLAEAADLSLRSRAWNDAKVTAHHAIIPTATTVASVTLGPTEKALYELIARRYVAQFLPPHVYAATRVDVDLAGECFVASGRETLSVGWRAVEPIRTISADDAPEEDGSSVPSLHEGDAVHVERAEILRRETAPPRAFTDASLLAAMVHVAAEVCHPRVKAILAEADGLGTPATRPKIIETLFERGFIERRRRCIVSTPIGRALVASLPSVATTPHMTAEWEAAMCDIAADHLSVTAFLARITGELRALVEAGKVRRIVPPPPPPPRMSKRPPAHVGRARRS